MTSEQNGTVSKPLRWWRMSQPVSVVELAGRAGVSPQTIMDIEHGRTNPWPRTVRKLADALGVQPSEVTEFVTSKEDRNG